MQESKFWKVSYVWDNAEGFNIIWAATKSEAEDKALKMLINNKALKMLVNDGLATNCVIKEVRVWGAMAATMSYRELYESE